VVSQQFNSTVTSRLPFPLAVWQDGGSSPGNRVNTCDVIAPAAQQRSARSLVYLPVPSNSAASFNKRLICHNIYYISVNTTPFPASGVNCLEFFILKKKSLYENGLGNVHPALCSSLINILFHHSGLPAIFKHFS
jgi:hypothetical protein